MIVGNWSRKWVSKWISKQSSIQYCGCSNMLKLLNFFSNQPPGEHCQFCTAAIADVRTSRFYFSGKWWSRTSHCRDHWWLGMWGHLPGDDSLWFAGTSCVLRLEDCNRKMSDVFSSMPSQNKNEHDLELVWDDFHWDSFFSWAVTVFLFWESGLLRFCSTPTGPNIWGPLRWWWWWKLHLYWKCVFVL